MSIRRSYTARCRQCLVLLSYSRDTKTWTADDIGTTCYAPKATVDATGTPVHDVQRLTSRLTVTTSTRTPKAKFNVFDTFDAPPVLGQYVTGTTSIPTMNRTLPFGGYYMGVRASEHDGQPVHFFLDGHIDGTPQGCFTHPVDRTVDPATTEATA